MGLAELDEASATTLGALLALLARADDVASFTHNYRDRDIVFDVDGDRLIPAVIVTTTRHRVWVVNLGEQPSPDGSLTRALAQWCEDSTLRDRVGRTFRSLHLSQGAEPHLESARSFEEFAVAAQ
jgi:hypothetical protein